MKHPRSILMVWMALSAIVCADGWKAADPDYVWSFPEDHWAHRGAKTEWWYFTGHLEAADGRRFGYQFTFFRVGILAEKPDFDSRWTTEGMVMGHAALSLLPATPGERGREGAGERREGVHRFSEVLYREMPLLGGFGVFPDTVLAWSRGPLGTDDRWELACNGSGFDFRMRDDAAGFAFELSTRPVKPMVFQGPNGYSRKGAGPTAASQYYSFTRLATAGSVVVDGERVKVVGESWMDKEFGSNQLSAGQTGWDWFSLQLDDGREVMLYVLRGEPESATFARGTVVSAQGKVRYLRAEEFAIDRVGSWKSEETDALYPSGWRVTIPEDGVEVMVRPEVAAQENRSSLLPGLFYWEGAVAVERVAGKQVGKGYVELTGYGTESVPAI